MFSLLCYKNSRILHFFLYCYWSLVQFPRNISIKIYRCNYLFHVFLYFPVVLLDHEISLSESRKCKLYRHIFSWFCHSIKYMVSIADNKVHLLQTVALVKHLNCAFHLQFNMVGVYLFSCFVEVLLLSLSHMLYVIFLCYAVVVDILVFPGCVHFYFVSL